MKLSALLLLAAAPTCMAQSLAISPQAAASTGPNPQIGIVDSEAVSRAATAFAEAAANKELQKVMDHANQANCPVVLTSAWMTPHLMLLTAAHEPTGSGIDLEFNNVSGKEIRLMEFSAKLLVKKSVYDLGYLPPIYLHLTAYGTGSLDQTFAQVRHLPLPDGIHAGLLQGVTLEQVTFDDGSIWTPVKDNYCGFSPSQSLPVAR
jgi:hypothetical protein